ncbi:Oryzain beta chain [Platanthera guangdongensis]|uniref:Oryzain beta chain n=1 Tax=Platanthera guangdongensis TaxID=2320717 RepID=A0ABR2LET3_9ASPA
MLNTDKLCSTYAYPGNLYTRNLYSARNAHACNAIHRHIALRAADSDIHHHCILRTVGSGIQRRRALRVAAHNDRPSFDYESLDINTLPTSIDWLEKGAVNPIRNQGKCGMIALIFSAISAPPEISSLSCAVLQISSSMPIIMKLRRTNSSGRRVRGSSQLRSCTECWPD